MANTLLNIKEHPVFWVISIAIVSYIGGFSSSEYLRKEGMFTSTAPPVVRFGWLPISASTEGCRKASSEAFLENGLTLTSNTSYFVTGSKSRVNASIICLSSRSAAISIASGQDPSSVEAVRQTIHDSFANRERILDLSFRTKSRQDAPSQATTMLPRNVNLPTCTKLALQALSRMGTTQVNTTGNFVDGIYNGNYVGIACHTSLPILSIAVSGFMNEEVASTRDKVENQIRVLETDLSGADDSLAEGPDFSVNWIKREMTFATCIRIARDSLAKVANGRDEKLTLHSKSVSLQTDAGFIVATCAPDRSRLLISSSGWENPRMSQLRSAVEGLAATVR